MALRTMTFREKIQARLTGLLMSYAPRVIEEDGVKQLQLGNKSGITWVPGGHLAKIRVGRVWVRVLAGKQSLDLHWGLSR